MSAVLSIEIAKIRVLNPRARNKAKFSEIVASIAAVGLKRPITVCARADRADEYDLVCGQGRVEAFLQLGQTHIPAMVVEATSDDRYIKSLVENIARNRPHILDLVRGIAELEQRGYSAPKIAEKVGLTETYVRGILRLHAKGEELLLAAVERGDLPIHIAIEIASAKDEDVKRCLAEAYERDELRGKAIAKARSIVERRLARGKRKVREPAANPKQPYKRLTTEDLVKAYKRSTQKQALLVRRAQVCESMLRIVCSAMRELTRDENFITLLRAEGLDKMPKYLAEQMQQRSAR